MARDTTDDARSFSTFFLNKHKKLKIGCASHANNIIWSRNGEETGRIDYDISTLEPDPHIHLKYKTRWHGEQEWRSVNYRVALEALPCRFGGQRWYFRCPLSSNDRCCNRRVAILYSVGDYFGCRHCVGLTYKTCLENSRMRGFPWKILADSWKADELAQHVRVRYYNGKPTRKYRRCLKLWGADDHVLEAEKALLGALQCK